MHLVNDYLHCELKHSNSHAFNVITLLLLTVSDIDSSSYT